MYIQKFQLDVVIREGEYGFGHENTASTSQGLEIMLWDVATLLK